MSTVVTKARHTPEELLSMDNGQVYELVNGNLVECNMSWWTSYFAGRIFWLLNTFCEAHQLGWKAPEGASYQCFPDDPDKVRRADVSFIRLERLRAEQAATQGHLRIHPDLVGEVISPKDLSYKVEEKVEDWLRAGVSLVWVVNPATPILTIRRLDQAGRVLRENDEVTGEEIIPGFRCQVREFFRLPSGTAQPE